MKNLGKFALSAASLLILGVPVAQSGEKKFPVKSSVELDLYGAFSGGHTSVTNPDGDSFILTNLVLGVSAKDTGAFDVILDSALGGLSMPTLWDGGLVPPKSFNFSNNSFGATGIGLLWAYMTLNSEGMISLDVGLLPTNVGYEVANTYANPNITLGTVWFAQPIIYPAARINVSFGAINLYAEYNQDGGADNFAFGSLGEIGPVSYAISYFDYENDRNIIDVVGSTSIGSIDLGVNFDYQMLDSAAPGQDQSAFGVAFYFIPNFGSLKLPVRFEYFSEGSTGIYTGAKSIANTGYSLTVTPTFQISKNSYIRAEAAYLQTQEKVFANNTQNNRTVIALEAGFTF
jgi:hypothetical protein